MKTLVKVCLCTVGLAVIAAAQAKPASQPAFEGTWKVAEVHPSGPNASPNMSPQPGLYIFTKKHYSTMTVTGASPRPDLPQQNVTDAQRAATWGPFTANSGTYEIKGSTVTTHALVAKNPGVMSASSFTTYEFKFEGNALWLTNKANNTGPIANPTRTKLVRVE